MIGKISIGTFEGDVWQLVFARFEGGRLTVVYWVDDGGKFYGQFAFDGKPVQGWTGIDGDTQEFEFRGNRYRLACPQTQPGLTACHLQKLEWVSKAMQAPARVQKAKGVRNG